MISNTKRDVLSKLKHLGLSQIGFSQSGFSQDGFSMMEIMVAVALSSILLIGVMATSTLTSNNSSVMHGVMFRDEIVRMIQQLSTTPQTLIKTLALSANTNLQACVNPPAAGPNTNCVHNQEYPLALADMAGDPVSGPAGIPITNDSLAGTPLYYSVMDGSLCKNGTTPITAPNTRCAFEVVTSFIPNCSDAGNSCMDATKIAITIQYRVRLTSVPLTPKPLGGAQVKDVIAPPAPLSYVNAMSIRNGYFTN